MEIRSFKVERFRSITTATLDLSDLTVLVGPNNEGKSNILRAMVLGMNALAGFTRVSAGSSYRMRAGLRGPVDYDWDRDFPLQARTGRRKTTAMEFEFRLDDAEIEEFTARIGSRINGDLRVGLTFSQDGTISLRIIKKRVGGTWTEKSGQIAAFVGSRVGVEYVASFRTAQESAEVVSRLVSLELQDLANDDEYQAAIATISRLQEPRLKEIAVGVEETLAHFLPDVKSVEITLGDARRSQLSPRVEIIVDDGEPTSLEMKGDGVQSLAAIALLRRAAMDRSRSQTFVLAVEEPEAHLHPFAIRELRRVLTQIAAEQQVVVTTHSPLLADPLRVERNVIVEGSRARSAKKISDVRDSLGVRLEDNLQSARLAVVVEGETDVTILRAVLAGRDPVISEALASGTLVIEGLGGGGKLGYRLSQYASGVCGTFVFIDNDLAGRNAIESARSEGLLAESEYRLAVFPGKAESELEDLIDPTVYLDNFNEHFGLSLTRSAIRKGKKKWSKRIESLVSSSGKLWTGTAQRDAKMIVSSCAASNPKGAIADEAAVVTEVLEAVHARLAP